MAVSAKGATPRLGCGGASILWSSGGGPTPSAAGNPEVRRGKAGPALGGGPLPSPASLGPGGGRVTPGPGFQGCELYSCLTGEAYSSPRAQGICSGLGDHAMWKGHLTSNGGDLSLYLCVHQGEG